MRNEMKRLSAHDLVYALIESIDIEARVPHEDFDRYHNHFIDLREETISRIASLQSQLAEAKADLSNTREAWNECENTLAEAKAKLAGYEEGYDPKVRLPKHDQWILVKHMNDDLDDAPRQVMYDSGDDGEDGVKYYPYSEDGWVCWTDITRWFPLPDAKEDE